MGQAGTGRARMGQVGMRQEKMGWLGTGRSGTGRSRKKLQRTFLLLTGYGKGLTLSTRLGPVFFNFENINFILTFTLQDSHSLHTINFFRQELFYNFPGLAYDLHFSCFPLL
jgi:hypothetical protein